jgi:hypothetical protein
VKPTAPELTVPYPEVTVAERVTFCAEPEYVTDTSLALVVVAQFDEQGARVVVVPDALAGNGVSPLIT